VRRFYRESFLLVAAHSRKLAYHMYIGTDGEEPDKGPWGHPAQRIMFRRFRRFLAAGRWSDAVCTHFLPLQLSRRDEARPMHLVVTDWDIHRFWVQPTASSFFVASDAVAATFRRRLPRVPAHVTGIPVAGRFRAELDRAAARRQLGLDARAPVVLIMGGGWGLGVAEMARSALATSIPGLAVLAVCGANACAYDALAGESPARLRTFGFVEDVAPLIAAADLVVSKPGGVTTSETLALGRPLLLTRGLPGHEDRNSRALVDMGAARFAEGGRLTGEIQAFFGDALLRESWTRAALVAGRPEAAARIASVVLGDAEARRRRDTALAGAAAQAWGAERPR